MAISSASSGQAPAAGLPKRNGPRRYAEIASVAADGPHYRLIVACNASTEDRMPASVDMVKSSISRLTQSL